MSIHEPQTDDRPAGPPPPVDPANTPSNGSNTDLERQLRRIRDYGDGETTQYDLQKKVLRAASSHFLEMEARIHSMLSPRLNEGTTLEDLEDYYSPISCMVSLGKLVTQMTQLEINLYKVDPFAGPRQPR